MRDRRGSPRYRCNLRCELHKASRSYPAILLDVSRSGLSVQVDRDLAQGDEVEISVERGIQIRAIAWRARPSRSGFVVGMMLSDVTPAYQEFIEKREARNGPPKAHTPASSSPPEPASPAAGRAASECWWRLRVKEIDGPRTRTVMLSAATRTSALEKATAELGPGWEVIEAQPKTVEAPKEA